MEVSVFDTYIKKKEGGIMHFDILVPVDARYDEVITYGKAYLKNKDQEGQFISSKECKFCHIEKATPEVEGAIREKGYYIVEMQGC